MNISIARARERTAEAIAVQYSRVYMVVWCVWIGLSIVAHLIRGPVWLWIASLVFFAVAEGTGLARRVKTENRRYTFSALVWLFLRGGWARGLLVAGWVLFLLFSFVSIGQTADGGWYYIAARWSLGAGAFSWLFIHFMAFGREGQ